MSECKLCKLNLRMNAYLYILPRQNKVHINLPLLQSFETKFVAGGFSNEIQTKYVQSECFKHVITYQRGIHRRLGQFILFMFIV